MVSRAGFLSEYILFQQAGDSAAGSGPRCLWREGESCCSENIHRFHQNAEVQQAFFQPFHYVLGFTAYAFNLCNPDTRSMLNTSVLTEAAAPDTVIGQIKAPDCADQEQAFLPGESRGGFAAAYAAA